MKVLVCTDPDTIHSEKFLKSLSKYAKVGIFWYGDPRQITGLPCKTFIFRKFKSKRFSRLMRFYENVIIYFMLLIFKPDVIHIHRDAKLIKKFRNISKKTKIIFSSWGHLPKNLLFGDWGMNLASSDAFTGDCQTLIDELKVVPNCETKPSVVFRFGISEDFFTPGKPSSDYYENLNIPANSKIVYSARSLRAGYNHETLVKAIPIILQNYPETIFIFVNNHGHRYPDAIEYIQGLKKQIAELGVEKNVRFLEHNENRSKVAELFKCSDVVVSIPVEDGFPATIFEAMACGVPTIVSDLADYDGVVSQDNAIRINPYDYCVLANSIKALLSNQELWLRLSKNGIETVAEKGNLDVEMRKLLEFYSFLQNG